VSDEAVGEAVALVLEGAGGEVDGNKLEEST